jgi:hypothetical protein
MGPGCPAGVLFEQQTKPAARNGVPTVDLSRVQLAKHKPERGLVAAALLALVKGAVLALAVWGLIFALLLLSGYEAAVPPTTTKTKQVTT